MLQLTPANVADHVQYHKHLVPLNLQPYGQQKICLLIIPVQKVPREVMMFADCPEAIYLATNLRTIVIFVVKLEQTHFATVTPGIT